MTRVRARARGITVLLAMLLISACGSWNPLGCGGGAGDLKTIVVGSADFPESKILAEIYAQSLEANGFHVGRRLGIGSRETYIPALRDGSIDLIPEYTGSLLTYFDPEATATSPQDVELALLRVLPGELSILTPAEASDTDSIVVTADTAQKWKLSTIADLAPYSLDVKIGALPEFQKRPQGLPGLKKTYGLYVPDRNFVVISDGGGPTTVRALLDGTLTAANIFSTSPAIRENNLVALADPFNNFPAGNVVPVLRSQKKSDELKQVLDAVSAKLTTQALIELNAAVWGDHGVDPDDAARKWLADNGLNRPIRG